MANAFTISRSFPFGNTHNKELVRVHGVLVIDSAVGAEADDIPASLFGLQSIVASGPAVNDDNSGVYSTAPAYDLESLLAFSGGVSLAATPVDLATDTYKLWVEGTK